ncbi:Neopullulanase [Actinokineospora spheciospongiae]|uniref:Neopullulanase n=1 Tax=Actinokineospora spheciospongiae TaxID=909613 RepID=W7JCG0_9PSEU|nr:alpha-amylase family glycosyl hydrolase [Actinokineospora spheciospongiae]EWC63709.1 Neopullulanase [Actinokineospora spheciospongiae]
MGEPDWVRHAIWWHGYPLGMTGAYPADPAPGPHEHRLLRLLPWLDHAVRLGASGIALGPVFASTSHGYDTTDHFRVDPRLGDDQDFDTLVTEARQRGLRVLLDGVFNHVGPGFGHPGWLRPGHTFEGHEGLLTLDHANPEVRDHVTAVLAHWLDRGADAWRLDAAYATPPDFWADVLPRVRARHPGAWFVAEVIHGDYADFTTKSTVDSVTQYELWKAVWSSLNDGNPHELAWALTRHDGFLDTFVPATFVGNHDVTRIAAKLTDPHHLPHALVVLFTTAGTPAVYAGDELGLHAVKEDRHGGDDAIRPEFPATPEDPFPGSDPAVLRLHQDLIGLRRRHPWLHTARTRITETTHEHLTYESTSGDNALVVTLNYGPGTVRAAGTEAVAGEPADHLGPFGWRIARR